MLQVVHLGNPGTLDEVENTMIIQPDLIDAMAVVGHAETPLSSEKFLKECKVVS